MLPLQLFGQLQVYLHIGKIAKKFRNKNEHFGFPFVVLGFLLICLIGATSKVLIERKNQNKILGTKALLGIFRKFSYATRRIFMINSADVV